MDSNRFAGPGTNFQARSKTNFVVKRIRISRRILLTPASL
jgi:hypothetical protein